MSLLSVPPPGGRGAGGSLFWRIPVGPAAQPENPGSQRNQRAGCSSRLCGACTARSGRDWGALGDGQPVGGARGSRNVAASTLEPLGVQRNAVVRSAQRIVEHRPASCAPGGLLSLGGARRGPGRRLSATSAGRIPRRARVPSSPRGRRRGWRSAPRDRVSDGGPARHEPRGGARATL